MNSHRYAVDILDSDMGPQECTICFEEFHKGQKIIRLACLCVYRKNELNFLKDHDCISGWFDKSKTGSGNCPVHSF